MSTLRAVQMFCDWPGCPGREFHESVEMAYERKWHKQVLGGCLHHFCPNHPGIVSEATLMDVQQEQRARLEAQYQEAR